MKAENKQKTEAGRLFLVATPIGDYDDITIRALNILRQVDIIICEELKPARRLLAHYKIEKPLFTLNEHNEEQNSLLLLEEILSGKEAALISDCGTPLFSDPGSVLVDYCIKKQISVIPAPGANSLMPALTASGFDIDRFFYYGWLSPRKNIRRKELAQLKQVKELLVILDTPYRIRQLLRDAASVMGGDTGAVIAYKITMEEETFFRGTLSELSFIANKEELKGEFVLLIDNRVRAQHKKARK
jgi:16S rRNA (cytidine1402-2'-O)-methyltransferase